MMLNRIIRGQVTQFWDDEDNTWHSQEFETIEAGYWFDPDSEEYLEDPEESKHTYLRPEMMNPTMEVISVTFRNTVIHCERWNGKPSLRRAFASIAGMRGMDLGVLELLKEDLEEAGFLQVDDARITLRTIKTHVIGGSDNDC